MDRNLDQSRPAPTVDAIEAGLAKALEGATEAGRWDVVSQLARELEARRLAREGIPKLFAKRVSRAGSHLGSGRREPTGQLRALEKPTPR